MTIVKRTIVRTIECNRCKESAEANEGPRNSSKPIGWGHLSSDVKLTHPEKGYVKSEVKRKSIDLCPKCVRDFEQFMEVGV